MYLTGGWEQFARYFRLVVESASIGNMKRTWSHLESELAVETLPADEALREAVQIKNIWIPFGA